MTDIVYALEAGGRPHELEEVIEGIRAERDRESKKEHWFRGAAYSAGYVHGLTVALKMLEDRPGDREAGRNGAAGAGVGTGRGLLRRRGAGGRT